MFNKKTLLSLCASVVFTGCMASTDLNNAFLKETNEILNGKIDRIELGFQVDGKAGKGTFWMMSKEQFVSFKKLIEYAVVGPKVISDLDGNEHLEFTGELGFVAGRHYCGTREASLFEKVLMCVKAKSIKPFMEKTYVRDAESFTHVLVKADLRIDEFRVIHVDSRLYRNVPATSQIGNLPGLYLRGNGKTAKTGDLVGFSFRPEKNGQVYDYFFGQLWIENN